MRYINEIIIHCTATKPDFIPSIGQLRDIHRANGWRDIGYHYVVYPDGSIKTGRPVSQAGAHCYRHNNHSIGVAYIGGLDDKGRCVDTRTPEQKQALTQLVVKLITMYRCDVWGHRDFSPDINHDGRVTPEEYVKECPCFDAHAEYHHFYESIALRLRHTL